MNGSHKYKPEKQIKKKKLFKTQFIISILLLFFIIIGYLTNLQIKNSKEYLSQEITNDYNIKKLYNSDIESQFTTYKQNGLIFTVIGMIEIPKIKIYYPIISELNNELLEIAPCRISGPMPNEVGNLCIAGHNYDNYKFFSKISNLSQDDEIIIYDMSKNKISYHISRIYEVSSNDLSPLENSTNREVTLITCNNINSSSRIIIKAISE